MVESKQKPRSTSYPSLTLEDALNKITTLKNAIGVKGAYNRETIASAIGYTSISGASARAVASLVYYGLLEKEKDQYKLSKIGLGYLLPTHDGEDREMAKEAVLKPTLFSKIYEDYAGQVLPKQLNNILSIKYGIQNKAAAGVVRLIESSFRFAGVLGDNNILAQNIGSLPDVLSLIKESPEEKEIINDNIVNKVIGFNLGNKGDSVIEQGTNLNGNGWSLTVLLKTTMRLDPEIRKDVSALLESAYSLSDKLYATEDPGDRNIK